MLEGLYSAAAGMAAQQERMDALANDVANVSTTAYKRTRVAFRDLVYQQAGAGVAPTVRTGAGAAAVDAGRSLAQGVLRETGRQLDLAIEGPGFIQVRRADGTIALTRDGALQVDARGRLTTSAGELLQPAITIPAGTNDIKVGTDGTVLADGRRAGRIQLVDVRAPSGLTPLGDNLFQAGAASGAPAAARGATIRQGNLESSNVDLGEAMVGLMEAQRNFALASRAIQTQDRMLEIANGIRR